jgi:curli biogenesis system outer membrane secretion channel CsgG
MSRRFLWALLAALLALPPAAAQAQEVAGGPRFIATVAEGSGPTRDAALTSALLSAVEQVTGVAVGTRDVAMRSFALIVTDRTDTFIVSETARQEIARVSGGIVRSYRVVDARPDGTNTLVRIEAEIAVFRATQDQAATRRRIAVSEFVDQNGRRTTFGDQLRERLVQYLTQSRRFAVLDRSNLAAYDREMAVLASDSPLTERVRIGQVLGTDYIVVGRMRSVGAVRREQFISITGELIVSQFARGNLDFQVLEIATRQVLWAGSITTGTAPNLTETLERMVTQLGREVTQSVYPLRLVQMNNPEELILNQGGVTVNVGQRFRAMLLGEEIKDPYTMESLGRVERETALVQVIRVDDRLSYARLIAGELPPASDVVLRLAPPPPPAPPAPPAPQQRRRQDNRSMFD